MNSFFRLLTITLLTSCLAACGLFTSDSSVVRNPSPLQKIKEETVQLVEVWSRNIGEGVGNRSGYLLPVVQGNIVYVAGAEGAVSALDKLTGKVIWKRALKAVRVSSGVAVNDNLVLLGTIEGEIIALSTKDGSDLWKARVSSEVLSLPVIAGSVIVVKSVDDKLTALNATTGKVLWTQDTLQPALTLRGSSAPVIYRDAVFAGFSNGDAKAFLLNDGSQLWSSRVAAPQGRTELERMVDINGTPIIIGNVLYIASYQGKMAALELRAGRLLWSKDFSSYATISEGFGSIYIVDEDSLVSALDQKIGASNWRQEAFRYRRLSASATLSSYVVVGDYDGYIHLLSQVDGRLLGRFRAGSSAIRVPPQVDGDMLYVLNSSGKLMALKQR